jgi:hypothetical protein
VAFLFSGGLRVIHSFRAAVVGLVLAASPAGAQQAPPPAPAGQQQPAAPAVPASQQPAGQTTTPPPAATPAPIAAAGCPAPVPPATPPARAFGSQTGLLLHPVQPTRVADFELFLRYVRDALAKSTNPTVRNQARGWKFYRVTEAGPNGDILYAFLLDPAVPCVDYALGPIVAEAYPDPAQLQEIWKLYTGSVRSGGTIMNMVPLPALPAPPVATPATTETSPAGQSQAPPGDGEAADPAAKSVPPGARP